MSNAPDPITAEVVRNAYNAIADDMSAILARSAYSPIIYEAHDYGIALFDAQARLLGQYAGLPLFTGGLDAGLKAMIEEGFLSYNELSYIDGQELATFTGLPEDQADEVVTYAEDNADFMDQSVKEEQRQLEEAAEQARIAQLEADRQAALNPGADPSANPEAGVVSPVGGAERPHHHADAEGSTTVATVEHPVAYHEGPPTDSEAAVMAIEHEEQRTGEDGEQTATIPANPETNNPGVQA